MNEGKTLQGIELRSLVTSDGRLELTLHDVDIPEPDGDEVVVRIEGAPIHPSDIGLLLGAADLTTIVTTGNDDRPVTSATISAERIAAMRPRMDQSMSVGNEGAGTVVKAGANAQALLGKTVALAVGGMYTQYRLAKASHCLPLADGTKAVNGAACFVNPLTTLSMVETMRLEGYQAMIHTAAASTIGQMLVRVCIADDIPLVNIVRNQEQMAVLRELGAQYIVDSSSFDFMTELTDAIAETGAMIAFDAVGGGDLPGRILAAMESAANRAATCYSRYGSTLPKQVYIYGSLDARPTIIDRSLVGMYWGVEGFMLGPFLEKIGTHERKRLEGRIAAELETTFAIQYTAEISLAEALSPDVIAAYAKRATGEKYLINPAKDL